MGGLGDLDFFVAPIQAMWSLMASPLFAIPAMIGAGLLIGSVVLGGLLSMFRSTAGDSPRKGV